MRINKMIPFISGGTSLPVTSFSFSSIQPGTLNQVSILLNVDEGYECFINFGDGGGDHALTADGYDYTYTSVYATISTTYTITISGNLGGLRTFIIGNEATVSNLNLNDFAAQGVGLTILQLGQLGSGISGSLALLPSTVYLLDIQCTGTTISGALVDSPSGITFMKLTSLTSLSGAIPTNTSHPGLFWLYLISTTGVNGTISTMPSPMRYILIQSVTGISGSFTTMFSNCQSLTNIFMFSIGTLMTGTSAAQPPTTLRGFTLFAGAGSNYTFDIEKFSHLLAIFMQNLGSCTGRIETLTALTSALTLRDIGTGVTYGGGVLPAWSFGLTIRVGFNSTMVDDFLIAYNNVAITATATIDLRSPNSARTSASDAAVTALQGKNRTVLTS